MTTQEDYLQSIHTSITDLIDANAPIEVWRALDTRIAAFRDGYLNDNPVQSEIETLDKVTRTLKEVNAKLDELLK